MVASIAGIVGIKLFAAGLQRGVSVFFQRITRLKKVDLALSGTIPKRKEVKEALSDLEIVLGTYRGELTASMGQFLDELERSGLVEAMVQASLLEKQSSKLRQAFVDLYNRFLTADTKRAESLFDRLSAVFLVVSRELSKDQTLFDLVRLQHADLSGQLASIEGAIRKAKGDIVPFEQLESTILKIARAAQASFKHVRIETHRGAQDVEIAKIYIAPKLTYRDSAALVDTMASVGIPDLRTHNPSRRAEQVLMMPYSEVKSSMRRVVILGDPGGGKSTLCQRVCFDMAKSATHALSAGSRKEIPAHEQKIPIRVTLRQYEQARQQSQLDIRTFIARDLKHGVAATDLELEQTIQYLLENGRALLAFDGLDEVLDTARRREYVDVVTAFCNAYPMCPVLITSRVVGYDFAPMGGDFEHFVLERFEDQEVAEYATKFMQVVGGKTELIAKEQARKFIEQTNTNASDLRRNPLMLGLMCWLFYFTRDVPTNRPEIYKECAILMFEKWDPDRGIFADVPKDFDRLQLFTHLASKIYGVPELAAGVTKEWLQREGEAYFRTLYSDKGKAIAEARRLVKFLTGRAWVMTEIGDGIFAFTHQTFLEYFFARSIDDACDSVEDVIRIVLPRIAKRERDVVNHLALQIKSHRSARRQEQAIDALVKAMVKAKQAGRRKAICGFLAGSLEYLSATEPAVQKAIEAIYSNSLGAVAEHRSDRLIDLAISVASARERKSFAETVASRLIAKSIQGDDEEVATLVATSVFHLSSSLSHRTNEPAMPMEVVELVRSGIRSSFSGKAITSPLKAAIAWAWFGDLHPEKFSEQAVPYLFRFPPIGTYMTINGLLACALSASELHRKGLCDDAVSQKGYDAALSLIADEALSGRPIHVSEQDVKIYNVYPPMGIWLEILEGTLGDSSVAAGTYVVFKIHKALYGIRESQNRMFADRLGKVESALLEIAAAEKKRWPIMESVLSGQTTLVVN